MWDVDWHREMLADGQRVRAFGEAVRQAVEPGDVVLDVGTGTGFLALVAARAGAEHVYAVERGEIISVAREIAVASGLDDRITFLHADALEVRLDERVDVIVAEIIGSFGLDEDILRVLDDARGRLLKAKGRLLPDALELVIAPTEEGEGLSDLGAAMEASFGLDFQPLVRLAQHTPTTLWADADKLLGPGATVLSYDLTCPDRDAVQGEASITSGRSGRLCGWVGWFVASHCGRTVLSTEPPIPGSSWENVFFPIGEPLEVAAGETMSARLRWDDPFWSWEMTVGAREARHFSQIHSMPAADLRPRVSGDQPDG